MRIHAPASVAARPARVGRRARWLVAGRLAVAAAVLCAARIAPGATPAAAADLEAPRSDVEIADLRELGDGGIGGFIVNHTATTVRDVELAVEERWLWADERHPGTDNPGRTVFARYRGEIPPGASQCFVFHPSPPRPERSDGRFQIAAQVSQYMQVYAAAEAPPTATHARIVTHREAIR